MSIRVMTAAWNADLPASEKLVLLALADNANDEGHCWPSATTIARKCGQGERTVRRAIQALIAKGHVEQRQRSGTSAVYTVHPCHSGTPATAAPLPQSPPTPATAAPKPSGTVKLKKDKPSSMKRAQPRFELPSDIPAEPWAGFEEMRRRIGKAMTDRAKGLAVSRLRLLAEDGWPPGVVLDHCTLNSYQGIFPPKADTNGSRNGSTANRQSPSADGLSSTTRAAQRVFGAIGPG